MSRDKKMFLTPWVYYRYMVNPQGKNISGHAYISSYDQVLEKVECWEHSIVGCMLWGIWFADHSWHGVEFLTVMSNNQVFVWQLQA